MNGRPKPIERYTFETSALMTRHLPVWRHPNKHAVFEIACLRGTDYAGALHYSRWPAMPLPAAVNAAAAACRAVPRGGFYEYAPEPDLPSATVWHVNFADPHLFIAYGSSLFAQDEMQVAEHPALGVLREALIARGAPAVTVEGSEPTPVLVMGVERRCRVATDPDPRAGRPLGLYGNRFAEAAPDAVRCATAPIDPPTLTNVIAMAALPGGSGRYRAQQIEHLLRTAYTGFRAAVLESRQHRGEAHPVVVHTGFWGCGAFGGNRTLMAMLQILASGMAALDRLVVHTADTAGEAAFDAARRGIARNLAVPTEVGTEELIDRIAAMGFRWGVSNGT